MPLCLAAKRFKMAPDTRGPLVAHLAVMGHLRAMRASVLLAVPAALSGRAVIHGLLEVLASPVRALAVVALVAVFSSPLQARPIPAEGATAAAGPTKPAAKKATRKNSPEPVPALPAAVDVAPGLEAFGALPADPEPEEITRGQHYWIGNEDRLDIFHEAIAQKGGIHLGVGAEQNYILCGWSRCEVLVLMDFDQAIVDLHRVYRLAFQAAATKEDFKAIWLDKNRRVLRAAIRSELKGKERIGAQKALDVARWSIERRFAKLETQMAAHKLPFFLDDDDTYAWLRALVMEGKVFAVRGDLTAKRTVQAIGAAATASKKTFGSIYLSNAEQYFQYKQQTRSNFQSLPMAANSVVLRTHGWNTLRYAKGGNSYHYGVQTGPSFTALAGDKTVWSSRQILQWATPGAEKGTSTMDATDGAVAKEAFKAREKERLAARKAKGTKSTKPAGAKTVKAGGDEAVAAP